MFTFGVVVRYGPQGSCDPNEPPSRPGCQCSSLTKRERCNYDWQAFDTFTVADGGDGQWKIVSGLLDYDATPGAALGPGQGGDHLSKGLCQHDANRGGEKALCHTAFECPIRCATLTTVMHAAVFCYCATLRNAVDNVSNFVSRLVNRVSHRPYRDSATVCTWLKRAK